MEDAAADVRNLRGKERDMVRMFRRLLRGSSKQRVAGAWIF